jgi:hypothetical protein
MGKMCDPERAIADIRAIAFRRRCTIRCCHGRDTVPKEWTTLFRFLKKAYAVGLAPDFEKHLSGCPCPNSDGFDAVMARAYEHGLEPRFEYIGECCSSQALVAAYRHGMVPSRRHFAVLEPKHLVDVLRTAYEHGLAPDTYDFQDMEWTPIEHLTAWRDAVRHGAPIDFEIVLGFDDVDLLRDAYAHGGLAPDLSHVPFLLEHRALAEAYAAGLEFDYDTQVALIPSKDVAPALTAAYSAGTVPESRHFSDLTGSYRKASQLATYASGLLVRESHGVDEDARAIARSQITMTGAVHSLFGQDIGSIVCKKLFVDELC